MRGEHPVTEFELIALLTKDAPRAAPDLPCGVGDDCAVVAGPEGRDWLVTTDALIEGVHFRREWTDLAALGRKSLSVNISDIAAMGGVPRFYLVAIGLPPAEAEGAAIAISKGMREVAGRHGMALVGGDTVASPSGLAISITAIGEVPKGKALLRSGAHPGDAIYVTGTLGGAALGLACLRSGRREGDAERFVQRHLDPEPRVAEGRWVAATGIATAMIDLSDGLVADLGHIADASGVGFQIEEARVPRDPPFEAAARALGADPAVLALTGGEDYELCFTIDARRAGEFERRLAQRQGGAPITRIGTVEKDLTRRDVLDAEGKPLRLKRRGFDHFA